MRNLEGLPCVLCGADSSRKGEHVWPSWFLSDFFPQGPFGVAKAGVAYTARDSSEPLKTGGLPGVHVPMCEPCNGLMNGTLEEPVKPVVRRLIPFEEPHTPPTLSAQEVRALALWILKVGLLSAHPAAVHDLPHVNNDASFPRLEPFLPEWISWIRTRALPPEGFSLYATRRAVQEDVALDRHQRRVALPRIVVDDKDLRFCLRSFGFRGTNVTIVWHPGWEIDNAQVNEGRAIRLWPTPGEADFAALPEVNPREFEFVDASLFTLRTTRARFEELARTPLDHRTDPMSLMIEFMSD